MRYEEDLGAAARAPELERVRRLVSDGSCAVLSLDVFDTVLWRRVPRPTDVFAMLGARLRREGRVPDWITDGTFRLMRIDAEQRARERSLSTCGEVSLFDIWREVPPEVFVEGGLEDLVRAEVELEREVTVPDLEVAELLGIAERNSLPIALVSDTYFTAEQLRHLLDQPGLEPLRGAEVFRSHQHGLDKASGLWEIVLQELGTSPEQVVHVGDNQVADDEVPAKLGIRTVHYQRVDEDFGAVLRREGESTDPFGPPDEHLHPDDGDAGLTSLRAKTVRAVPDEVDETVADAWRYGAGVLGPVLTGFAAWVARRAHEMGQKVVWCPMREGELLSELVDEAARTRGWEVTAKPIWLSRQITSVAALDSYDQEAVREFIGRSYRLTVSQLLQSLHLRPGDVPALADKLDMLLDQPELRERVTVALTEAPHLRNRLATTVAGVRDRLLRSLREAGALDAEELVLVDLGWGGTIQYQLARVLRRNGSDVRTAGYYLATDHRSGRLPLAGQRTEGYLGQSGCPHEVVHALSRSPEVIEQCVSARCGSLLDFTDLGEPVLGTSNSSSTQELEWRAVQDGIRGFQHNWNRHVRAAGGEWPLLNPERLAEITTAALKAPSASEAAVFGSWRHDDNFGSSVVTRILPGDLMAGVPYMSPADLDDLHMRDAFWPALLAAADPQLSAAVSALRSGAVDPALFEMVGEGPETRLRFRTSDDEWHDGPRRRVRVNHNGLSFARIGFESHGALDVSLAIPGQPAIVRVDWVEVAAYVEGDPEPKHLRWERSEDFAGLVFADCDWLGGTMIEFHEPHGAVWLPIANRAGGPVTSAQVTIAFASLPQSRSGLAHRVRPAPELRRLTGRLREELRAGGLRGVAAGGARMALRKIGGAR
ncbi:HAD family hydrolase [Saccharopolyspora griseoalba]|uniref:HAD family hydrolase n=1 Tax=Saccharopolyspora griseoalba TaxID=1431848 RepID=A0ABW2LLQ6_9PSEU